ncbi:MAG: sulfite exporter TauE/SafE family protein [Candidatus Zixiibacteriota bacterium]|nr:MAG: sulfite exporter TauE/SafE family protein [candidate division Zixibacteria bacterium]
MLDFSLYLLCGLVAGLLGGYLGLGGGIVMMPFLTVIAGVNVKAAVPVSITAIVVNSLAASSEYLKKGMVDLELVVILSVFMVLGNITGSLLSEHIPGDYTRLMLTVIVVYAAFSLLKGRRTTERMTFADNRARYLLITTVVAFVTGALSAVVGIGGGVVILPVLYLVIGLPLSTARGTTSLMIGFSAAAATTVYFLNGQIEPVIVSGVILGIIVGAKLGGFLGTMAKPLVIKLMLFSVLLYLAFRLAYEPVRELL